MWRIQKGGEGRIGKDGEDGEDGEDREDGSGSRSGPEGVFSQGDVAYLEGVAYKVQYVSASSGKCELRCADGGGGEGR